MSFLRPQILVRLQEMFSSREDYQKRCDELLATRWPRIGGDLPFMEVRDCGNVFKIYVYHGGIAGVSNTYRFPKSQLRPDQIEELTRRSQR